MRPIVEGMGLDWASQFAKLNANQARWGLDTKRRAAVAGRLKDDYPVADLLTAIDGCKASAWHQGRNDRQRPFNDLGLICRDSAHVEQFIELARGQQAPAWRSKRLTSVWWPNIVCWGDAAVAAVAGVGCGTSNGRRAAGGGVWTTLARSGRASAAATRGIRTSPHVG
jgi:hypothetical protein